LKTTQRLHELGQSLWIDNITRDLLNSGLLKHAIEEWSVTGLISNPTTFGHATRNSTAYDATIRKRLKLDMPLTSSGRSTTKPTARTGGCRWKCRPF